MRWALLGPGPLFPVGPTAVPGALAVASAVAVGVVAGAASTLLTLGVYKSEDAFRKIPVHWMWWPAIGGLAIGLGGLVAPRALGVGYDTIDALLLGKLAVATVAILLIVKSAIWAFSLGSGTSGGVLAPLMLMGGALGAIESLVLPTGSLTLWVMVGIGAMIGGTMRSPLTGAVFPLELTHDFNAALPLLAGSLAAEFFTVFSMRRSILTEKVARRGVHVAREYSVDPLERISVGATMRVDFKAVRADLPISQLVQEFLAGEGNATGYPVVDDAGSLVAFVTRRDIIAAMAKRKDGAEVMDIVSGAPVLVFPDEPMRTAADRMETSRVESVPVVDPFNPRKV
ncbi:MAG TPA: chloride channel protein, partial [Nitrososphaerales archaeon]|nr:chloride channel protein [Nitrososphaerales archaeon]